MSEGDPVSEPSLHAQRSIAKAQKRPDRTDGLVLFLGLTLALVAVLVAVLVAFLRRPFSVVVLSLATVGCVTVQTNIAFDEGSGATSVKAAKQDIAPSSSNITTTNTRAEVPISLVPK